MTPGGSKSQTGTWRREEHAGRARDPPPEKGGGDLKKKELGKDERIKREIKRVSNIYSEISEKERAAIEGLIRRAAFMRVTLEDMEADLDENGFTEFFTQSKDVEPYERERPIARLYNTMNKNYQGIMKQLTEFVVKEPPKEPEDEFEAFVNGKE